MAFGLAETAKLAVDLSLTGNFARSLSGAQKQLSSFDRAIDSTQGRAYKAGTQIGTGIKRGVAIAATGTAIFAGLMVKAVGSASNLNETISKTKVVFGPAADSVLAFGKTSAKALGLSEQAADEAAATYGNLFVSMGLVPKQSAKMSTALVQLAGDLASFNNVSPEEALQALQSGLVGEIEPLRKFGVNLNEQTLKAEALKLGLVKLKKGQKEYTQVLTPAQKAQAAYALIFEQTKTAQGDYARTSSGLANQLRTLRANFSNLAATLGTAVLPQIAKITSILNDELAKPENIDSVKHLGEAVAGLFTDENIRAGTGLIKGFIDSAVAAAPILEATAKTTLTLVQAAVSLFKSLPAPLQQLAVGAFAINKLTGGLVTTVTGGLISQVLKQFTGGMNVTAGTVVVNGAVSGSPGGGSAPGGFGLGSAAALAGGALVIGGVEAAGHDFTESVLNNLTGDPRLAEAGANISTAAASGIQPIFGPINRLLTFLQTGNPNGGVNGAPPGKNSGVRPPGGFNEGEAPKLLNVANERLEAIKAATAAQNAKADALNASVNHVTANDAIQAALTRAKIGDGTAEAARIRAATDAARSTIAAKIGDGTSETRSVANAVRNKDLSVSVTPIVNVKTSVSVKETINQTTTYKQYFKYQS